MLIRLEPLPGELDRGYLGRLGRFNGVRNEKDCLALVSAWAGLEGRSGTEVPRLELLRRAAGTTLEEFVCRHTTLPFRRGITSYLPGIPHGDPASTSMLWATGMRVARPGAYFCEACAAEDLDFHGFSYWRRDLQIPGVLSCEKHDLSLSYVDDDAAFYRAPASWIGACHSISGAWALEAAGNAAVRRYLDICASLLDRPTPIDVRDASRGLADRARQRGLTTYPVSGDREPSSPLLSDLVADSFGVRWLAPVFPDLVNKPRGRLLSRIDGVLYLSKSASSVVAYALAASALFDSADEAMRAMLSPDPREDPPSGARASRRIEDEALRHAYFTAQGDHAAVALALSFRRAAVGQLLNAMGLPNLQLRGDRSLTAAIRAYIMDGQSIEESAAYGNVTQSKLQTCIRLALGHLRGLLAVDNQAASIGEGSARRIKQLAPHEVERLELTDAYVAEGALS